MYFLHAGSISTPITNLQGCHTLRWHTLTALILMNCGSCQSIHRHSLIRFWKSTWTVLSYCLKMVDWYQSLLLLSLQHTDMMGSWHEVMSKRCWVFGMTSDPWQSKFKSKYRVHYWVQSPVHGTAADGTPLEHVPSYPMRAHAYEQQGTSLSLAPQPLSMSCNVNLPHMACLPVQRPESRFCTICLYSGSVDAEAAEDVWSRGGRLQKAAA